MILLKLLRAKQWIKNVFVLVPLIFSVKFTEIDSICRVAFTFISFCLASSFIYITNDIVDRKNDAIHPKKKFRPIASGQIGVPMAILTAVSCLVLAGFILLRLGSSKTAVAIIAYIVLNLLYSWKLKHIPLVDVSCIAFGFEFRVYAGAYAIGCYVSSWLFLTMLFLSLFLALGKRKSELSRLGSASRKSLEGYSVVTIDRYLIICCSSVIISYALYTMDSSVITRFGTNRLVYSVVFIVYGMFRYLGELEKSGDFDDPTDNLYKDIPLIVAGLLYVAYILLLFTKIL